MHAAELKAEAANRAAAELQRLRNKAGKSVTQEELAAVAAAAAARVSAPVSLHLLRPDELKAGMITQTAVAPQLAEVFSELFTQVIDLACCCFWFLIHNPIIGASAHASPVWALCLDNNGYCCLKVPFPTSGTGTLPNTCVQSVPYPQNTTQTALAGVEVWRLLGYLRTL